MDLISELSDDLLIKILLLVPTKVAVSTSILAKQWEHLWRWLPKLEYGGRNCSESERERLRCFLDRNMPLHRALVIETFRLQYSRFKPENINMWVLAALSHCLRELDIVYESYPAKPNILPSNLYTSKSLVILKLDGEILLDVPRMVALPSLKTLKLQSVRYVNDETLQRLLSNCPILEDLLVALRGDDATGKLTISVPSLQSFSLHIPYYHAIDGFVIETPNLKYFKVRDHNPNDLYCLVENMPYLIEAYLDFYLLDFSILFGSIRSVKRLSICSKFMFDEGFVFNQLEHLEVCLCKKHFSDQLPRVLKASPNLQGLHLFFMDIHVLQGVLELNQPSTVPECLLSSLQTLRWSKYTGKPQERDIVVYILKHAVHLKTATITSSESIVPKFQMLKELALSSRASAACQLMFE